MKDRTKLALAKALQDILRTKTLDDVRVSELCTRCDLQRQSFYYHFRDKYDLVAWIFLQDFKAGFFSNSNRLSRACITDILCAVYEKKAFYLRVLADRSQNIPLLYIQNYIYGYCQNLFRRRDGVEELSEDLCVKIHMLIYGSIGVTYEWLMGRIKKKSEELAALLYSMVPQDMLQL